jgi:hypothetical protein
MQTKIAKIDSYQLTDWRTNKLNKLITHRGSHQQEIQYLFDDLYGSKAVTRQTRGRWKHMDREIKKRERNETSIFKHFGNLTF